MLKKILGVLLGLVLGGLMGWFVGIHGDPWGLLIVLLAFYGQVLFHEGGHLIAGLLTGYRFVSLRVASLMLIRQNGKYRLARYSLAGTGGQCLMAPPPLVNGDYPYTLYHLGGVLMNLLCALIAALCLWRFGFSAWWLGTLVGGLYLGLTNGIPMQATVDNDGRNALRGRRDEAVRAGFYRQLQMNAALADGKRLRDLPDAWFDCAPGQERERGYLRLAWMIDRGEYEAARVYAAELLSCDLLPLHQMITESELRCLTLLAGDAPAEESKTLRQYLRASRNSPSALRTEYLFARLQDHDEKKAAEIRQRFDKLTRSYPYAGDLQSDIALMDLARTRAI